MYRYYNPNPESKNVGDCTVRAITKATGRDWETVYAGLSFMGFTVHDMPSANHVWGAYLRGYGYNRYLVDDKGEDCYTVKRFCEDNPDGIYVLAIPGHVVCVKNGDYFDSWDSGDECPQYYWRK